ncbi:MAG TPA: hypothetical protein PKN50_19685, partial [Spirochaetota bacterium]|nr:hypothetical protein [Spirochaetota bacterium]HPV43844.1 hypothetical protein [Spirochaetota bacterium]
MQIVIGMVKKYANHEICTQIGILLTLYCFPVLNNTQEGQSKTQAEALIHTNNNPRGILCKRLERIRMAAFNE